MLQLITILRLIFVSKYPVHISNNSYTTISCQRLCFIQSEKMKWRIWCKPIRFVTTTFFLLTVITITFTLSKWVRNEPFDYLPSIILLGFTTFFILLYRKSKTDFSFQAEQTLNFTIDQPNFGPLLRQMRQCFNLNEINELCFLLNVNSEELSGETLSTKIQSLIHYLYRQGRMNDLITLLQKERSHLTWQIPTIPTTREFQLRHNILQNVYSTWIEGFLKQSLHHAIAIELNLTYHPDALIRRTLYVPGKKERAVEKPIHQVFDNSGGSLLILGNPGSGKTITLLQLAEQLIQEAQNDSNKPIPIILNLSSWTKNRGDFIDWLEEEIFLQYQVARKLAHSLIAGNHLLYLLDGLDEVTPDSREGCISIINEFKANHPAEIIVCSRISDYEKLHNRLNFGIAIYIQPLDEMQIQNYLNHKELELDAVRTSLETDPVLRELTKSPLMLSIITLAYRNRTNEELLFFDTTAARRKHIIDTYITEMFLRRPLTSKRYSVDQAKQWLINLAYNMKSHGESIFYIERIEPSWLGKYSYINQYSNLTRLIVVIIIGSLTGLIFSINFGILAGLILGTLIGLLFGFLGVFNNRRWHGFSQYPETIKGANSIERSILFKMSQGAIVGGVLGIIISISAKSWFDFQGGLQVTLMGILFGSLISGINHVTYKFYWKKTHFGEEEMYQTVTKYNAVKKGVLFGFLNGMIPGFVIWIVWDLNYGIYIGIFVGIATGIVISILERQKIYQGKIVLVEELQASLPSSNVFLRQISNGLKLGLSFGFLFGLIAGILIGQIRNQFLDMPSRSLVWFFSSLFISLLFGFTGGMNGILKSFVQIRDISQKTKPNQGIRNSIQNALKMGFIVGAMNGIFNWIIFLVMYRLVFVFLMAAITGPDAVFFETLDPNSNLLIVGLFIGLIVGLLEGFMDFGGSTMFQHYTLRILLSLHKILPFSISDSLLTAFLDDMVDHIFLRRIGGGWIFIHRIFLEHFASLHSAKGQSSD